MNELARLVPVIFDVQACRITDRNGKPWFLARDVCQILELKNPSKVVRDFPAEEVATIVCDITSSYTTYAKPRARKTQKFLIINESAVMRLILKSRKKNAWEFKERIIKLVADADKKGINRALLGKTWSYAGEDNLTYPQYRDRREKAYFRRHPDATLEDFLKTLPG